MAVKNEIAEIEIFDEIDPFWGIGAKEFKARLDEVAGSKSIKLMLNTPGGSVFEGMAIYNMLSAHRAKLDIEVMGLAASIGSIIALAGRSLTMAEGSYFMIHNPLTVMVGDAEELRKTAGLLDKMKNDFINIYAEHTGMDRDEISDLMDDETWLTAAEAVEAGFASGLSDYGEIAASVHGRGVVKGFANLPSDIKMLDDEKVTTPRELESILRDAGCSRREAETIVAGYKAAGQGDPVPVDQGDPVKAPKITPAMLIREMDLVSHGTSITNNKGDTHE
jgi:ATP-dependent Clp endopeptidase proteolytic subunit ClpP